MFPFRTSTLRERPVTEPLRLGRLGLFAVLLLFGVSLAFRLLWLGRVPGIHGDEGWYGTQVVRMLHGKSWTGWTPSRLPVNPQLFCTETALLLFVKPSGFVLRLPIAIWSIVGVVLTFHLHRSVYKDRTEAVLVSLLTACLPAHLAYARFCWDSSFSFVSVPLVLYPTLRIVERDGSARTWACLAGGSILAVWTHATHAVFVLGCLLVVAWLWLMPWLQWALAARERRRACAALSLFLIIVFMVWQWEAAVWFVARGEEWLADRWRTGLRAITTLIDLVTGLRAYEFMAGVPRPNWVTLLYAVVLTTGAGAGIALVRSGRPADRALATLFPLLLVMLLAPAVSAKLRFGSLSYERYVLYFVPLTIAAFVRSVRTAVARGRQWAQAVPVAASIVCSGFFLVQFWQNYLHSLDRHTYWERMRATAQWSFGTGPVEPKSAVAAAILSADPAARVQVYA